MAIVRVFLFPLRTFAALVISEKEITAANAGVLSGKLTQMANGAIYDDLGGVEVLHNRKLDALEDIVESANGKPLLIAYWYKHDRDRIEQRLAETGYSWERLEKLGLEYRYCSLFLKGDLKTKEQLYEELFIAIRQFAKRQETWFRMMEKKGVEIHWLSHNQDKKARIEEAVMLLQQLSL